MDDLERVFASSPVEYVGPFEHHDVIVNGRRVPHLEAIPTAGALAGTLDLRCDAGGPPTLRAAAGDAVAESGA